MEVMGLMLGEFIDEYTVQVVDVFAMPQSGTGVSVEAVDPVFQTRMLDMLRQTNRPQMVVGWYHSHPGFGCWLSGVDINVAAATHTQHCVPVRLHPGIAVTAAFHSHLSLSPYVLVPCRVDVLWWEQTQQSFEALNKRAVAVVVDPIQSVKGKVVIDAFRLINPQLMMMGGAHAPRQTTSNLGHLRKPSIQALIHNLNRHYYSINIAYAYRKNELEQKMLLNLHKKVWTAGLTVEDTQQHRKSNEAEMDNMLKLCKEWSRRLDEEEGKTDKEAAVDSVGKLDPKKHLQQSMDELMTRNIAHTLGVMLDLVVF